jgi:xanthine dehydrogenase accessory factor
MMDALDIFTFLSRKSASVRTALVTVTQVAGSSMRNPGAHLAVADDGDWCGSLSGGCIEAAVVAEAMAALASGRPREVRFGAGSPYIDIRLPCGGSLDVLVTPLADPSIGQQALKLFEFRQPFVLALPFDGCDASIAPRTADWRTCRDRTAFKVSHVPQLAVVIIGHGASVTALDAQARTVGAATRVFTPDRALAAQLSASGTAVALLNMPDDRIALDADRWTAIAFVFHDHDWETRFLIDALASPAFYVGAMGGRQAQARRVAILAQAGVADHDIARLRAPIGLIPASREPQVLAVSVLAEIVRDFGLSIDRVDSAS